MVIGALGFRIASKYSHQGASEASIPELPTDADKSLQAVFSLSQTITKRGA